jgi:hypothetical protein
MRGSSSKEVIEPFLISEPDAAKTLALSPRRLWSLRKSGQIRFIRLGRLVRYDPLDLRAWIENQKSPPIPSLN